MVVLETDKDAREKREKKKKEGKEGEKRGEIPKSCHFAKSSC